MKFPVLEFWLEKEKPEAKKFMRMILSINFIIALIILYFSESTAVTIAGKFTNSFVRSDLTEFGTPAANAYHLVSWITFIFYLPKIWRFVRDFSDGGDFLQRFFLLLIGTIIIYELYLSRSESHHNSHKMIYWMYKLITDSITFPIGSIVTTHMQFVFGVIISSFLQKILIELKNFFQNL